MIIEILKRIKIKANYSIYLKNREKFIKKKAKNRLGYEVNIENPITFNEKLLWLKLYWYDRSVPQCVDKLEVREVIKSKGYSNLLIPLIGEYKSFQEIDFTKLPDEYVLKATHNSGGVVVVNKKNPLNIKEAEKILTNSLKRNYYDQSQEWIYKKLEPKIICEEYLKTKDNKIPRDYKLFCFNGKVEFLFVASERGYSNGKPTTKFDFYTRDWDLIDVKQGYDRSNTLIKKPDNLSEMIDIAEDLSKDFPQVRVDFYNEENVIKFGELTFFHFSGMTKFEPNEYDKIFGDLLDISNVVKTVYADEQ